MIKNYLRHGNFTSSEIVALLSEPTVAEKKQGGVWGKPALTYIEECNMERRLQRSLTDEISAKPLTWGKLLEQKVDDILGIKYSFCSTDTIMHPTIKFWSGSPDGIKHDEGKTVVDFKCPMTLKSFCQLVDPLYEGLEGVDAINAIRENHKDGEKYYWQLLSNSILTGAKYAELIIYVPYESELQDIKVLAQQVPGEQLGKHYWIAMANEGELPFIKDGGYYKNLNIIRFEVPEEDKKFLTSKVLEAGKLLIQPSSLIAEHKPELGATIIEKVNI